jgi:hypothetical protein
MIPADFSRRGNALFLILIAVALFAALAYAVTQSGRSGNGSINKEQTTLVIAQTLDTAAHVQAAVTRLGVIGNIPEYLIDYSGATSGAAANTSCTSAACKLFDPQGGGVTGYALPQAYWASSGTPSQYYFMNVTIAGNGIDTQRDFYLAQSYISREYCLAFNSYVGVSNPGGEPPTATHGIASTTQYTGNINAQVALTGAVQLTHASIDGRAAFCYDDTVCAPGHCYEAVMVIIPR